MRPMVMLAAACAAVAMGAPTKKEEAKDIADQLSIRVGLVTNFPNKDGQVIDCGALGFDSAQCGLFYMKVTNKGPAITSDNWQMYFHLGKRVLHVQNEGYQVEYITGDLHKLTPTKAFSGFAKGTTELQLAFESQIAFNSDFFPRYWIEVDNDFSSAAVIANTNQEGMKLTFVDTIPVSEANPDPAAPLPPANLKTRYEQQVNNVVLPYEEIEAEIMPKPFSVERTDGVADLSKGIFVSGDDLRSAAVKQFYKRMATLGVKENKSGYKVDVKVSKEVAEKAARAEGYTLSVDEDGAEVVGFDERGAFYGLQSLASLVKIGVDTIPTVDVVDFPYLPERRMQLDVARNFKTKNFVYKLLDQMAAYKLNLFHFHLSDDQGWRLEIPGLPELTEVGGRRCHSKNETQCLLPQVGSGPSDNNMGTGHFTRKEYIDILKYAHARYIEVFPEFDMPGHSRAAVVSMEARYRKYAAKGDEEKASEYRLMDPDDTSNFVSLQHFGIEGQVNPCMPGAVRFVNKLVKELKAMHDEAGAPLNKWHFGADEVKNMFLGAGFVDRNASEEEKVGKGQIDTEGLTEPFGNSPVCQKFLKEHGMTELNALVGYLATEVSKAAEENGIETFMAWHDGMKNTNASQLATERNVLNLWEAVWWGGSSMWAVWAERGYQLVMSCPDFLYYDFTYENSAEESGFYWGSRSLTPYKTFSFAPLNLGQNAETSFTPTGAPYSGSSPELPNGLTPADVIVGISGQLWTELVYTDDKAEYMIFPRVMALAERGWHKAEWELEYVAGREFNVNTSYVDKKALQDDWVRFANVMGQREVAKLDAAGIKYRVSVPGAVAEGGVLKTNSDLPGMTVVVSSDGEEFAPVEEGMKVAEGDTLYIAGQCGNRMSRVETLTV